MALRTIPATKNHPALPVLIKDVADDAGRSRPVVIIGMLHADENMPQILERQRCQLELTVTGRAVQVFEGIPENDGNGTLVRSYMPRQRHSLSIPANALVLGAEHIWHQTLTNLGTMALDLKQYDALGMMVRGFSLGSGQNVASLKQAVQEQRPHPLQEAANLSGIVLDRFVRPEGDLYRHFVALSATFPKNFGDTLKRMIDDRGNIKVRDVGLAWSKEGKQLNQPNIWCRVLRALIFRMIETEGLQYEAGPDSEITHVMTELFQLPPNASDPKVNSPQEAIGYYSRLQQIDAFRSTHYNPLAHGKFRSYGIIATLKLGVTVFHDRLPSEVPLILNLGEEHLAHMDPLLPDSHTPVEIVLEGREKVLITSQKIDIL